MSRVILIDDTVQMFASPENLCSYVEAPSFNGTERAVQEDGMVVELFIDRGAWIRGLLGRKKFLSDFEFVNFRLIENKEVRDKIYHDVLDYIRNEGRPIEKSFQMSDLFNLVERALGITE